MMLGRWTHGHKKKNEQPQQQANLFIARQAVVKKSFQLESKEWHKHSTSRSTGRQGAIFFFFVVGAMEFLTVEWRQMKSSDLVEDGHWRAQHQRKHAHRLQVFFFSFPSVSLKLGPMQSFAWMHNIIALPPTRYLSSFLSFLAVFGRE